MVTYDTVYLNSGITWTFRITRPANMFTPGHADTASRPVIISMPGVGEVGTDPANLVKFGPHYWLKNGWDGGVQLGNGKHYPILITILTSATNVRPGYVLTMLNYLLDNYHIKRNSVHVAGLSMGGFTWGRFICYAASSGDERAMSLIKSYTSLEGVANDNFSGYNMPGWTAFGQWAKKYGGKFFGLEGTNDTRDVWNVRDAMEATVPGSAYFSYQTIGGGAHCCWNSMYDPSATDWGCVAPITSPNIAVNSNHANSMGTYFKGENIFQWMIRQGDTTLVGSTSTSTTSPAPAPPTTTAGGKVAVGEGEYQILFIDKNSHLWGMGRVTNIGVGGTGKVGIPQRVKVTPADLTFKYVTGALHGGAAVDDNGYVWTMGDNDQAQLGIGNLTATTMPQKITIDSAGNAFNNVQSIVAFFVQNKYNGFYAIKNDGTLWTWGSPFGGMRGNGTNNTTPSLRPVQVVMPGNRLVKQIIGGDFAIALCTDGTVWTWGPASVPNLGYAMTGNQSLVPHQLTQLSGITQIAGGKSYNYALASNNVLYGWGQYGHYMGNAPVGNTAVYTPTVLTNITSRLPAPISKIVTNSVCTHAILTDGSLWGWGDGAQGNIGNGQEIDYTKTAAPYAWSFYPAQLLVQYPYNVAPTIKFADVWGTSVFTFYTYAMDETGQLYCWGRNKSSVLANGIVSPNSSIDASYANAWDVKWPQKVDPFALAAAGTTWISTSPWCITNASGTDCSTYPIPANTRPVSNAGSNQNITTATTTLDGSASTDNVHISYYEWKQISGPGTAIIDLPGNAVAKIYGLTTGIYRFQLRVTDNGWLSDSTTMEVAVNTANNKPPVANTGAKQTITLPLSTATLDGSKSTDPDGTISTYAWSLVSGPTSTVISNPASATTLVTGLTAAGTYIFKLIVTDNLGATATAMDTIIVNPMLNQPPTANAGADQTITLPANSAVLDGTASQDPNGSIASYSWTKVSGPTQGTIANATAASTTADGLVAGTYVFRLTVTDNGGLKASDSIIVKVLAATNQPPVADAGTSKTITLPVNSTTLDGTASSDPDGTIATYSWAQISGPSTASISNGSTATPTVGNLQAGQYVFELTVTDNSGATDKAQVKITVAAAANKPPVANAGANQTITLPVNSVTLNGSASSDPDGTIASYSWSQISGPSTASITNGSTVSATAGSLQAGQYIFELTVTDNSGATGKAQVKITVIAAPANQPPVANAGSSQSITLPVSTVNLDGTKSSDPDGTIASYSWSQIAGPATASISNGNTASPTVSGLQAGQYTFELTVTDNNGATDKAQVKITVAAAGQPPVANAGANQTITLPVNSVTLDGSASQDPSGTITGYSWAKISGPAQGTIASAGNVSTAVNNLVQGVYVFELTITDNNGASSTDQITITVKAAANKPPVANAGTNKSITLPANSVTLDASASSDPDGSIASYSWTKVSGPAQGTIASASGVSTDVDNLVQGTYVFQLTVTDNSGASSTDQVTVTVNAAANLAPVANAGANKNITLPVNSVTVNGSASSDPDGSIASYSWAQVSGPAQGSIASPGNASTAINNLVQGTYVFLLTVTDNSGASSTDQVTVTVNAAANKLPVANAGTSQTITLPVNSASLDGTKSADSDGSIAGYSWAQVSGPTTAAIANGNTATPTVSNLQIGQYVFELTVTDNTGATAKAEVKITVAAAANQAPIANAGINQTVTLPVSGVNLDGTKSFDADGNIVSYIWTRVSGPGAVTITNSNTATPTVVGLQAGQYVFLLTVTDNKGATGTDQVTLTAVDGILSGNDPLVADAGRDTTIALPASTATLDGSASSDPNGTISSYVWTQISGPNNAIFSNSVTAVTPVSSLITGEYQFQLTVTDNNGNSSSDTVKVKVIDNTRYLEQVILYPNPAHDIVNFRLTSDKLGTVRINVFDMNGKLVLSEQTEKQQSYLSNSMNISQLAKGMYTIQFFIGNSTNVIAKLIKQ